MYVLLIIWLAGKTLQNPRSAILALFSLHSLFVIDIDILYWGYLALKQVRLDWLVKLSVVCLLWGGFKTRIFGVCCVAGILLVPSCFVTYKRGSLPFVRSTKASAAMQSMDTCSAYFLRMLSIVKYESRARNLGNGVLATARNVDWNL